MGLQRLRVGPLLDEHERAGGLMQRVKVAAGLLVYRFDSSLADLAHGVDRLRLGGHGGDDYDRHGDHLTQASRNRRFEQKCECEPAKRKLRVGWPGETRDQCGEWCK